MLIKLILRVIMEVDIFLRKIGEMVYNGCKVKPFTQNKNKESRIISHSATVNDDIIFPDNWSTLYPEFYESVTGFKKLFQANKNDDGPDVLTGIIEKNISNTYQIRW